MTGLTIVAGDVGRGFCRYESGLFLLPDGSRRGVETVAEVMVHGGVSEKPSQIGQIVAGLRSGLAVASKLDLPMPASLAATALGAGLSAVEDGPQRRALVEIRFEDGSLFVAMTAVDLPPLVEHDGRVIRLALARSVVPAAPSAPEASMGTRMIGAVSDATGGALQAVSSAFDFVKSRAAG